MADSYNKKEREKKKQKRKKDKAARKEQRKQEGNDTAEFMYVDANGNLTSTPPDPAEKKKINIENIQISTPKKGDEDTNSFVRLGRVKFFNTEKGFGFIIDKETKESVFVHADNLKQEITENDQVSFEMGKGPKGPVAVNVELVK